MFVRTKHGADRLVKRLSRAGIDAVAMHGNKSQRQRESALRRFEAGQVDVLVATDVAARGIDVSGISHVINFDAPADHETYVHRVGRTGRAGRRGIAVTLVGEEQRREIAALADRLGLEHGLHHGGRPGTDHGPPTRVAAAATSLGRARSAGRGAPVSPQQRRRRRRRTNRPGAGPSRAA